MEPKLTIAICGGGNLAHGSIACIGNYNPDYTINLLSLRPELWSDTIVGRTKSSAWESRGDITGKISHVSKNAQEVVPEADIVIITSPAHTKISILKQIKPFIKEGCLVGTIYGQGAFDWQCQEVLGKDIQEKHLTIFSLQYVPFICKAFDYGKQVNIIGPKRTLYAASFPPENVHYVCNAVSQIYFIPCLPVPNFLTLTLTPSNQIIHPGRVTGYFNRFADKANTVFKAKDMPKLYEDLDDICANEIQGLDDEIQAIKAEILKHVPDLNLNQLMPIKERICTMYKGQVSDTSSLKRVFNTNKGYTRVQFPMLPVPGQDLKNTKPGEELVRLNFNARFFWEDMPYGLVLLQDVGEILGVPTPNCTRHILFHQEYMPIKYVDASTGKLIRSSLVNTAAPSVRGINTVQDLVKTSLASKIHERNNIFFKTDAKL